MRNWYDRVVVVATTLLLAPAAFGETLTVPSSGEQVESLTILGQGVTYVLVASGTYSVGGGVQNSDAEYIYVHAQGAWLEDYPGTTGLHDMTVNGQNIRVKI